mmetsp:Transcript_1949/g.6986  ORF Transcript_1949/g.6986 Transcript_1949/m.6986 type:complete len:225 (+) Transcript_1949:175-849(+)
MYGNSYQSSYGGGGIASMPADLPMYDYDGGKSKGKKGKSILARIFFSLKGIMLVSILCLSVYVLYLRTVHASSVSLTRAHARKITNLEEQVNKYKVPHVPSISCPAAASANLSASANWVHWQRERRRGVVLRLTRGVGLRSGGRPEQGEHVRQQGKVPREHPGAAQAGSGGGSRECRQVPAGRRPLRRGAGYRPQGFGEGEELLRAKAQGGARSQPRSARHARG